MSEFKVDVRTISKIYTHANADRLELANVYGLLYQFVIGKGQYQVGDEVVFFPIDSVIPVELVEFLGNGKFLSKGVRVKTVTLRGEIGQGYVHPLQDLISGGWLDPATMVGDDVTEALGVTKYEPPVVFTPGGNLVALPDGVSVYDIEGVDRFPEVAGELYYKKVVITEKIEGMNVGITVTSDGSVYVNQKNYAIEEIEGKQNSVWNAVRAQHLIQLAQSLLSDEVHTVTLRGEMIGPGIQENIYNLPKHWIKIYDIQLNGQYMNKLDAAHVVRSAESEFVYIIASGVTLAEWLNGRSIQEASNGKSNFAGTLREGIVITPEIEEYSYALRSRLQLKQRSPKYLSQNEF